MVWTFLMSSKDLVCSVIRTYILMVKTQFGKTVRKLRSDNGSELVNKHVMNMLNSFGIVHQRSCVRAPEQNGVVERKHRNLLSTSRALMYQSSLPQKFWPYSILTATWMINRLPSRVLDWECPYKIMYGEEPDLSILRHFGCLAFAANTHPGKGKFDSRSNKCIFLGYDGIHKGYLLYDIEHSKTLVSRDVKFVDSHYPYSDVDASVPSSITQNNDSSSLPANAGPNELECAEEMDRDESSSEGSDISITEHPTPEDAESSCTPHEEENRQAKRVRRQPAWMNDYTGHLVASVSSGELCSGPPPTFPYVVAQGLTPTYTEYLFNLAAIQEPNSYKEASKHKEWVEAMNKELTALEENKIWELVQLPAGKKPIGNK